MEQIEITLAFDDVASCVAFAHALEKVDPQPNDPFRILLPTTAQNMDNEVLQLLITFIENKGYVPLTALILLLREVLNKVIPDRSIAMVRGERKKRISSNITDDEAKRIARDLTSPRSRYSGIRW